MTQAKQRSVVKETIKRLGECVELISMDPHFNDISVGLFLKDRLLTVWSYSSILGTEARLEQIRDRIVVLGDLVAAEGSDTQAKVPPGDILLQPMKFMFRHAVEKAPGDLPSGPIEAADNKSTLTFIVEGAEQPDGYVYTVTARGNTERAEFRIKAAVGGFMRYGECVRVTPDSFRFPDSQRHDGFVRLLLPYARNVSAVERMLDAEDMTGQMTTQTLGFSST
jgi:hypothetical protein